jgi:hypothetical protein
VAGVAVMIDVSLGFRDSKRCVIARDLYRTMDRESLKQEMKIFHRKENMYFGMM